MQDQTPDFLALDFSVHKAHRRAVDRGRLAERRTAFWQADGKACSAFIRP